MIHVNMFATISLVSVDGCESIAMKCIFNLSTGDKAYLEMAKVLVLSATIHTSLEFICVFDGKDRGFREWMEDHRVTVLDWKISFLSNLTAIYDGKMSIQFCRGTYLCMELPRILEKHGIIDDYVLYVDTDVMFCGNIELEDCRPAYFSAPSDWARDDLSRFSTGAMVMNVMSLQTCYPEFVNHLSVHNYNFEFAGMGPCDQGAWNTFYRGKHEQLSPIYDWKPWWGRSEDARIIHFSGPKPRDISRLINTASPTSEKDCLHKFVVDQDPDAYQFYLDLWEEYAIRT